MGPCSTPPTFFLLASSHPLILHVILMHFFARPPPITYSAWNMALSHPAHNLQLPPTTPESGPTAMTQQHSWRLQSMRTSYDMLIKPVISSRPNACVWKNGPSNVQTMQLNLMLPLSQHSENHFPPVRNGIAIPARDHQSSRKAV